MATLRQFLIDQSTVPQGSTVREHIENPGAGGPGGDVIYGDGVTIEMDELALSVSVEAQNEIVAAIQNEVGQVAISLPETGLEIEIEDEEEITGEI